MADVNSCTNDSYAYYYDNACYDIVDICDIGGLVPADDDDNCFNEKNNKTISVGLAVGRMSSSEDFYK